jgi:mycothiol synthase
MTARPGVSEAGVVGLVIRPFAGDGDVADVVRIGNAENVADGVEERFDEESERVWLGRPSDQFDARRDFVLAELDGEAIAFAGQDWVDTRDGASRTYRVWGAVDPAYRGRGIGRALLRDNERRARALAATHDVERARVFGSFAAEGRPAARLLEAAGYEIERWFFEMTRPSLDGLVDVPLPDGIELRPITPDQRLALWRANREAFRDHWGGSDESEAAMSRFLDQPNTDPGLWVVAWDGDEIAAGVINGINSEENEALGVQRGWLSSVFTRRAWRRRGLARALIAKSLIVLRDRGMTSAGLGVDADNRQGALRLYEDAGFAVTERFNAWRKPMDPAE